jgi:hypothetical protein
VQRHDVGQGEQFVERHWLAAGASHHFGRNEGVEHQPVTLERCQSRCDFTPDATEADDPHGLISQSSQLIKRRRQPPFSVANMQRVLNHLPSSA